MLIRTKFEQICIWCNKIKITIHEEDRELCPKSSHADHEYVDYNQEITL